MKIEQKIPEGWRVDEFGKLALLSKKKYIPLPNEHIKCIELEHFEKETGRLNGYIDSAQQSSTKNYFKKGDVLYGKLRPYLKKYTLASFDGVCSTEIWVLQGCKEKLTNSYLYLIIQSNKFNVACNVSTGTHMPRADWEYISNIPFVFPPLPEQENIAEILSYWDDGIEKLSALIEKKKIQKKALMQQLLTGKHRLKGFSSPWHEVKLGELTKSKKILLEKGKNLNAEQIGKGSIPVIAGGRSIPYYHSSYTHNKPSITISASGAYAGYVWFHKEKIWASDCNVIQGSGYIDTVFLGYVLQSKQNRIYRLQTGGAQPHIYASDIKSLLIPEPVLAEQKAIAEILSKADEEIELLNKKLEAFKQEKKALMQQLLTGKIRVKVN